MPSEKINSGEDRISELPDDVLCYILSFLTTKEAIATSLLSKRWTRLSSMFPSLRIHCSQPIIRHHGHAHIFLASHTAQKITSFHLQCDRDEVCCSQYANEWVSGVVAKKVENLNISFCKAHARRLSFCTSFTCSTLVTLNIQGPFHLFIPSSVHLPNLKTMHLRVKSCLPHSNLCNLISESPALELFYYRPKFFDQPLDEMKIVLSSEHRQVFYNNWLCQLCIESDPDYDFISDVMELRTWPNIVKVKAYVTVRFESTGYFDRMLRKLRNVESLYFKYFRLWVDHYLLQVNDIVELLQVNDIVEELPQFNNLVELRLLLRRNDVLFEKFPSKCPKLKVLEFSIMENQNCISESYRFHVRDGVRERDLSDVHLQPYLPQAQTFLL